MSRKDYELIAAQFAALFRNHPDLRGFTRRIAESMADAFARDNSRFDRGRFLTACGFDD